jgi:hypothetical protein
MDFNDNMDEDDLDFAKKKLLDFERYAEISTHLINNTPELRTYMSMVEDASLQFDQDEKMKFRTAFVLGFAKCLHDVHGGYINLKIINIDKGAKHEDIKEPDNPLTRRNRPAQDEQTDEVAGE